MFWQLIMYLVQKYECISFILLVDTFFDVLFFYVVFIWNLCFMRSLIWYWFCCSVYLMYSFLYFCGFYSHEICVECLDGLQVVLYGLALCYCVSHLFMLFCRAGYLLSSLVLCLKNLFCIFLVLFLFKL
jgi:hypothetical protein